MIVTVLQIAAATSALAAAWFWLQASRVKGIKKGAEIKASHFERMATLNARAAISAGLSASIQAILIAIPQAV